MAEQTINVMDFDIEFDSEEILNELSEFVDKDGAPYLKVERKLDDNQKFFVTHLEIREFTNRNGAGGRKITNLLDSVGRGRDGKLPRYKAERRVRHTNANHKKEWFLVEVGMIINLTD